MDSGRCHTIPNPRGSVHHGDASSGDGREAVGPQPVDFQVVPYREIAGGHHRNVREWGVDRDGLGIILHVEIETPDRRQRRVVCGQACREGAVAYDVISVRVRGLQRRTVAGAAFHHSRNRVPGGEAVRDQT